MKRSGRFVSVLLLSGFFLLLLGSSTPLEGTLRYKKETGKKCTFCHSAIPEPGDEDPKLNEDGRKFKENGNRLTEEQKNRPE
jgi:hypothetical protein